MSIGYLHVDTKKIKTKKIRKAVIKLLKHQLKFVKSDKEIILLTGGYAAGKTESSTYRAIELAFKNGPILAESNETYILGMYQPTYRLIQDIYFTRFKKILSLLNLDFDLKEQAKNIYIPSLNTLIYFRSMDAIDTIVGYEVHDSLIDELDTLKEHKAKQAFDAVQSRNRLKKPNESENSIAISTTPEGFKFCYKLVQEYKEDTDIFEHIKGKTADNPYVTNSYLRKLMKGKPKDLVTQFLEGEFVNINGLQVYSNFDRRVNKSTETLRNNGETIYVGMDFNVGKMSAVISVIRGEEVHVVDEVYGLLDTPAMIGELKTRFKNRHICVYPDASGKNRKSNSASQTDISLLEEHFDVYYKASNPAVKDRVMTVNAFFCDMESNSRLFVNIEKCPVLVDNLEKQVWNDKGEPDKTSDDDHMLDALGYFIMYEFFDEININNNDAYDDFSIPG